MKTLPLGVTGLGAKSVLGNEPGSNDDTHDSRDFSAMLNSPPPERQPLPARPRMASAAPKPHDAPRQDEEPPATRDAAARPRAQPHAQARDGRDGSERQDPGRSDQDRHASAKPAPAHAGSARPQGQQQAGARRDDEQDEQPGQAAAQPADAPWPPAGLGGLETVLAGAAAGQPPPVAANGAPAPVLPGTPAPAVGAVAGAGAGAPQPALPGVQQAPAPAAPTLAPAPGAAALPGAGDFAARIAAASAELAPAKAADAIAAAAPAAAGGGTDAVAAPTPDAGTLLALHATPAGHVGAARDGAAATVFDGSPTPPPHLHEGFDDAVGARLSWLADQKIGHAHIKITPNDLGPVEVRLQLDGDKVNASFTAAHAEVRQALEQSLPRLRELLGQQGFQLGHADVGGQQSQGRQADGRGGFAAAPGTGAAEEITGVGIPAAALRRRGLLDAYA